MVQQEHQGRRARNAELVEDLRVFLNDPANAQIIADYAQRVTSGAGDEWLRLADVFDDTAGQFRLSVLDAGYRRWLLRNPGGSAADYLASRLEAGKAGVMARALLSNAAVGRSAARIHHFASDAGRAVLPGTAALLKDIDTADLVTRAGDLAQAALDDPASMRIVVSGALHDAADVAEIDPGWVRSTLGALLDHASGGNTAGITEDMLRTLVGGDELNGMAVSLDERAYRLVKALLVARKELGMLDLPVDTLTDPRMADALRDFVRTFVTRSGYEWGAQFELRNAADVVASLDGRVDALRIQLSLPNLLNAALKSGPDHILYELGQAFLLQAKAVRDLNSLVAGGLKFVRDPTGAIIGVEGPNAIRQVVADALRLKHWKGFVPPPGVVSGLVPPPDPAAAGWVAVAARRAVLIDDTYVMNLVMNLLREASQRTGNDTVDIMADVAASPQVKAMLADGLGSGTVNINDVDLVDDITAWLVVRAQLLEEDFKAALAAPDIVAEIGSGLECIVALATDGIESLPSRLWGG